MGGWGSWIIIEGSGSNKRLLVSGTMPDRTTNNQAETRAVIEALKILKKPCNVKVFTDSSYVVKTYQRILKGFPVKSNHDLWEEFQTVLKERRHDVTVIKIAGHSGIESHDKADKAAYAAAALRKEVYEETIEWH